MQDYYLCEIRAQKPCEEWRRVLTFISGPDRDIAEALSTQAARHVEEATGAEVRWHAEPMPFFGHNGGRDLRQLVDDIIHAS